MSPALRRLGSVLKKSIVGRSKTVGSPLVICEGENVHCILYSVYCFQYSVVRWNLLARMDNVQTENPKGESDDWVNVWEFATLRVCYTEAIHPLKIIAHNSSFKSLGWGANVLHVILTQETVFQKQGIREDSLHNRVRRYFKAVGLMRMRVHEEIHTATVTAVELPTTVLRKVPYKLNDGNMFSLIRPLLGKHKKNYDPREDKGSVQSAEYTTSN